MPLDNMNSVHYTAAEKTAANTLLANLEAAFMPKLKNLSGEERNKFGSVHEKNKLIINKVRDYRNNQPALSSPDVDWTEFMTDCDSRDFIQATIARLESMALSLKNNKIMHDYDAFQASLRDYEYSQYKNNTKVPGFEIKVKDLAQFFNRTGTTNKEKLDDSSADDNAALS